MQGQHNNDCQPSKMRFPTNSQQQPANPSPHTQSHNDQNLADPSEPCSHNQEYILQQIKLFESEQMLYDFQKCKICKEKRLENKLKNGLCRRCLHDKEQVKLFSAENLMDPGPVPQQL